MDNRSGDLVLDQAVEVPFLEGFLRLKSIDSIIDQSIFNIN